MPARAAFLAIFGVLAALAGGAAGEAAGAGACAIADAATSKPMASARTLPPRPVQLDSFVIVGLTNFITGSFRNRTSCSRSGPRPC